MIKIYLLLLGMLFLGTVATSCGGSNVDMAEEVNWQTLPYDLAAGVTLDQALSDITALSQVNFAISPDLQSILNRHPVVLPVLLGLNIGEVLTLLQDTMPPESAYLYQQLDEGHILLIPRFQQAEDLSGAVLLDIIEFDEFGLGAVATLVSDPRFEETCEETGL